MTSALAALGLEPREEVLTPHGYSLDAVVSFQGCEVAVEVDGPSHFVGRTHAPVGSTVLKRRQLRAAGWPLLAVPYWEWDAIGSKAKAHKYLEQGLLEALAAAASGDADTASSGSQEGTTMSLSWNEFQRSVQGQGLSREEKSRRYAAMKMLRTRGG